MLRARRILTGRRRTVFWGFVDQGFSSVTNFGLSVLAGRLLGPSGLGVVFLSFSTYLIVLLLQRSLVSETLLAITSALDPQRRARTASLGLTLSLLGGGGATIAVLAFGLLLPGTDGAAFLLVAPWLVGALLQDYWRNLLFRERRPSAAAANDGAWLLVMVLAFPVAWIFKSEWAVMTVWGLGACGGAVLGFVQTRTAPSPVRDAWRWWRKEAWPFGRWNAAASVVLNVGSNAAAFLLAGILGARDLGGYRAVVSLFAPLSLIGPAISLPGLPAVARAYAVSFHRARALATQLSGIAVAASLMFFTVLLLGGWRLLPLLFGASFEPYRDLVPAIAVSQVFSAVGVGYPLLLKVQQRGPFLLFSRLAVTIVGLGIVAASAVEYGLIGVAWGTAVVALISSLTLVWGVLRDPRSAPSPAPIQGADATPETVTDSTYLGP
jgi:O-antigen/teichoic acid export membrane protein